MKLSINGMKISCCIQAALAADNSLQRTEAMSQRVHYSETPLYTYFCLVLHFAMYSLDYYRFLLRVTQLDGKFCHFYILLALYHKNLILFAINSTFTLFILSNSTYLLLLWNLFT